MFSSCCRPFGTVEVEVSLGDIDSQPAPSIFDSVDRDKNAYPSTLGTSYGPLKTEGELFHVDRDDCDAETTYSTDSSTNDAELGYVQVFAHRLIQEIKDNTSHGDMLSMPSSRLDDILKGFAGRLHEESINPFEWEASVTLHRKRT